MARAKLPVMHMPIAPTPGPPHSRWAWAARARSQLVAGLLLFASTENSRETQTLATDFAMARPPTAPPGFPNIEGRYTVIAPVGHAAGEGHNPGMDPWDLMDQEHRRTRTGPEYLVADAAVAEG